MCNFNNDNIYIYKQKQQQQFYAYITCTSYTEKIDTENTVHPKNY